MRALRWGVVAGAAMFLTTACTGTITPLSTSSADSAQAEDSRNPCVTMSPAPREGYTHVSVFFTCEDEPRPAIPRPVPRQVSSDKVDLRVAIEELMKGPTAEERSAGFGSHFSSKTATMLNNVNMKGSVAIVDFGDLPSVIPNASTAAGSSQLFQELGRTIAQFPEVEGIEYRLNGSCMAFYEWLQSSCRLLPAEKYR